MNFKKIPALFAALILAGSAFAATNYPIGSDKITLGKPTAADRSIVINKGSGAANPVIKWDNSAGKLKFANDGVSFKAFGSGGGGGSGGVNLLSDNPDAESGVANWTASGGTFTTTTTAANVNSGAAAFSFTPSAGGQTVTSDAYATLGGMEGNNGCSAALYYKTAEGTNKYIVNAMTGSTVLGTATLDSSSTYKLVNVPFPCQTTGTTVKLQVSAAASTPSSPIYWDDAFDGIGFNTSQVSQARWIGSVSYAPTASCVWTGSSTTTPANFAAQSSCPTPTASGAISVPATKIPGFILPSGGPGIYRIVAKSSFRVTGNENCGFRFSDGTNSTVIAQVTGQVSAQTVSSPMIEGEFNYSTAPAGNTTIQIQSSCGITGTDAQILDSQTNQSGFEVSVYYFPSGQETAVRADSSSVNWSGTSTLNASTTSTSYGVVSTSLTGAISTTTSKNLTCTAASSSLGVTCSLPRTGTYLACFSGYFYNSTAGDLINVKLVDGSGTSITGEQSIDQPTGSPGYQSSMGACGNYTANSLTTTFQLYGKVSGGTGTFFPTSFSVVSIDGGSTNMQVFKGLRTTQGSGARYGESALIADSSSEGTGCGSSPCTVYNSSASWITVTRASAGTYTGTMSGFSGKPVCVCSVSRIAGLHAPECAVTSATSVSIGMYNSSNSAQDEPISIMCDGPH